MIRTGLYSSQTQLQKDLRKRGIDVTQATLSRDLEELQASKGPISGGKRVYALPDPDVLPAAARAARNSLEKWGVDVILSVEYVFNQIVVRTPPGAAQLLASAIDKAVMDGVLGCIAGDDTILVIVDSQERAGQLAEELSALASQ